MGFPGIFTWQCATDLNTQLTEAQVDNFVANNGYSTGAHTVDTNTQLTEAQVDAFVANNGYLTDQTIESKPFLLRAASGSYWSDTTSWTTVDTLFPLQPGNHITPSEIQLSGYKTYNSSSRSAEVRYVLRYADGTSYSAPSEALSYSTGTYYHERTDTVPVHAGMRGSIKSIDVQVSKGHASTSWGVYGQVKVTGFETSDSGLTTTKPFLLRAASGSYWSDTTSWTTVDTLFPLQPGNHITPSEIQLSGYKTYNSSSRSAEVRYVLRYADGTSYSAPSEALSYSTGTYYHERTDTVPVHAGMRGSIKSIDVQVSKGHASTSWGVYGQVKVTGFETLP